MTDRTLGLTTDLYELTMAAAYFQAGVRNRAVFELYTRRLPDNRNYLIAAGLEQALDYLSNLRIRETEIEFLRSHPAFKHVGSDFFDYLAEFRFTGDVWAMPEGTAVFAMEPLLRVEAPIIEAQIVETFLLSTINFQTLIASKASRVVRAAEGRSIVDFGTRRAHGTEAGLYAARAAFIAGSSGTSNVEAGHRFGIPTFGTLAHSFIMAFDGEMNALRSFHDLFPETATLLLDTYDTVAAARAVARQIGPGVPSVRLDSGDLVELSRQVREILDAAGMQATYIFASGDMNEYRIADIIQRGGRIDGFGVGTEMVTSYDAPALNSVYKLVSLYEDGVESMRIKLSPEKLTYPGAKQVWRFTDVAGQARGDVIALASEAPPQDGFDGAARPLLEKVMIKGRVIDHFADDGPENLARNVRYARLMRARELAAKEVAALPEYLVRIYPRVMEAAAMPVPPYEVRVSNRLERSREQAADALLG